jgi:hypothetical protein
MHRVGWQRHRLDHAVQQSCVAGTDRPRCAAAAAAVAAAAAAAAAVAAVALRLRAFQARVSPNVTSSVLF